MELESIADLLEREHHDIDAGIARVAAAASPADSDPEPLVTAMAKLRRHIYLEEELLFPSLRAAGMLAPVLVMLREHGQIWSTMDQVDRSLAGPGEDTAALVELLAELDGQLQRHNSKEEPILYPQADAALAPAAAAALREFLASGQLPDGWVCQQPASS
jgi:iron-sulfur cluster repair protein YtfE (RIC family)